MERIISIFQITGDPLETEHALVMLLLLYGLLTYGGNKRRWISAATVFAGILLALVTPVHQIDLFWPVITGLVVPPLMWQAAVAVTKSGPLQRRWSSVVWGVAFLFVVLSLYLFSALPLSNALLLGMLTVTLVWYFRELNTERTYLSTLGLIALAVLLVEIDLAVISLQYWVGTLFSGVAIGLAVGFLGIYLYRKINQQKSRNAFFFGWAYVAYFAGLIIEVSAIATTLAAALIVATYGYSIGIWYRQKDIPVPANTPFFFYLFAGMWLALGWQAHTSMEAASLAGVPIVLGVITLAIFAIRRIAPISKENRWVRLFLKEIGVLLLLAGSLLLWPRGAYLTTLSVEIALVAAVLLVIILREIIKPIFDFIGIRLSWPTEEMD